MNQGSRHYDDSTVSFDDCIGFRAFCKKCQDPALGEIEIMRQMSAIKYNSTKRGRTRAKGIGLKLVKDMGEDGGSPGVGLWIHRNQIKSGSSPHSQTYQIPPNLPNNPKITPITPITKLPPKTQPKQLQINPLNKFNLTLQGKIPTIPKLMKETGTLQDSSARFSTQLMTGKVDSTSSTTLFETKFNSVQISKQHNKQLESPVKPTHSQNNSLILCSIKDLSRVRKVETVLSEQSDSFDVSFLDLGQQFNMEQIQKLSKQCKVLKDKIYPGYR